MPANNVELTERLFEAVDTIVGERISSLPYDQTIVCQIVNSDSHKQGIYRVTHDYNTEFQAYADYTGYKTGDYVYVRIPEGDYTKQKVISGKYVEGIIVAAETENILVTGSTSYLCYDKNNKIYDFNETKIDREIQFVRRNSSENNNLSSTWADIIYESDPEDLLNSHSQAIKIMFNNVIVAYVHSIRDEFTQKNTLFVEKRENMFKYFPMLSNIRIELQKDNDGNPSNSGIFIKYQIASEFVPTQSLIAVKAMFCPIDEHYNISNEAIITFGYLPELDNNVSFEVELKHEVSKYSIIDGEEVLLNTISEPVNVINLHEDSILSQDETRKHRYLLSANMLNRTSSESESNNIDLNKYYNFYWDIISDVKQLNIINFTSTSTNDSVEDDDINNSDNDSSDDSTNSDINNGDNNDSDNSTNNDTNDEENENNNKILTLKEKEGLSNELYFIAEDLDNLNTFQTPLVIRLVVTTKNNQIVQKIFLPLAFRLEEKYVSNCPNLIMYNVAGINPVYTNNLIYCLQKDATNNILDIVSSELDNNFVNIVDNFLSINTVYFQDVLTYLVIKDYDLNVVWFQSLLICKDTDKKSLIANDKYYDIITGHETDNGSLYITHPDDELKIEAFTKNIEDPIFSLSSKNGLSIGYEGFVIKGDINGSIRGGGLKDENGELLEKGNDNLPIYFSEGKPVPVQFDNDQTAILYWDGEKLVQKAKFFLNSEKTKINPTLITSTIQEIRDSIPLEIQNNGQLLKCNNSSDITITLPEDIDLTGFEVEIVRWGNKEVTISPSNIICNTELAKKSSGTLQIKNKYDTIAIKCIAKNQWLINGPVKIS